MAAPVIAASTEHVGSAGTSCTITGTDMPNWAAGDLCLIFTTTDGAGNIITDEHFAAGGGDLALTKLGSKTTDTPSSGWFYRWCTGAELDVDLHIVGTNSEPFYVVAMQITGADGHDVPFIVGYSAATTQNPDPPSAPILKESRDVLYLAAESNDHSDTWASGPSGWATVQNGNSGSGSGDCGGAVAFLSATGSAAVNPGTFGLSGSEETVAWTIAILGNLSPVVAEGNPRATAPLYDFGQVGTANNVAFVFPFTPHESCSIQKVAIYAGVVGSPTDDARISLRTAYNGANAVSASVDVQAAGWYEVTFASPYAVTAGTTYWIYVDRDGSTNDTNYYQLGDGLAGETAPTTYRYNGSTYVSTTPYSFCFQARKTSGTPEWTPVDPMGASGFFGT